MTKAQRAGEDVAGARWEARKHRVCNTGYRYKVPAHITLYDTMVTLSLSHMIRLELSIG